MKRPLLFGIAIVVLVTAVMMIIFDQSTETYDTHERDEDDIQIVQLVLFSDAYPYRQMMEITRPYYRQFASHVRTIYYCFDPTLKCPYVYDSNHMILRIRGEETYVPGILNKTLDAVQFAVEHFPTASKIVRSNVSTIVDIPKMCEEIDGCHIDYGGHGINELAWLDPAGGVVDQTWFGTRYASGTCIILSMDMAYKMIKNRSRFRTNLVDDLSLGVWMREYEPEVALWCSKRADWFYRNRKANREDDLKEMKSIVDKLKSNDTHK